MVFTAVNEPFAAQALGLPHLKAGEALVEVTYATICTSDLHSFYGRRAAPCPGILGHEIMGQVVALGPGAVVDFYGDPVLPGDRITWSVYAHDHDGPMARKGLPQKSPDLFKYGHEKLGADASLSGGFATHCHLRAGTDIFKLPPELSPREAAPLNCTHATIAGALRLAGDLSGKNVLISGVGMLGLSACAMSRESRARRVWAMDIDRQRRDKAMAFGADGQLDATWPIAELLPAIQASGGIDVLIETSGAPVAMEKGMELLHIGGIQVWVGAVYAQRDLAINAEKVVRKLLTIKGLHNYVPADLAQAIRFLAANHRKYPFGELVHQDFPLQQLDQAFAQANQPGHYRIGVVPEGAN